MNREIKFRGKDVDTNQWVYGSLMVYNKHHPTITWVDDTEPVEKKHTCVVYPDSVGEYTGLRDKNGQEIYEGDIIKTPLNNLVAVQFGYKEHIIKHTKLRIFESFACYGWIVINLKNDITEYFDSTIFKGEVIGNVFDNSELLNEQ